MVMVMEIRAMEIRVTEIRATEIQGMAIQAMATARRAMAMATRFRSRRRSPPRCSRMMILQLGDLDGDGCADLVLDATGAPPRVNIYPSTCDGSFSDPPLTRQVTTFDGFALGDLDGDARDDLMMRGTGFPPRIEARLSTPNFGVGLLVSSEVYTYDSLWSVDVTGDGRPRR